eukprot:3794441-Rhodomonas_salina.1
MTGENAKSLVSSAIRLRASYALPGTDIASLLPIRLRACYAQSGTGALCGYRCDPLDGVEICYPGYSDCVCCCISGELWWVSSAEIARVVCGISGELRRAVRDPGLRRG